MSSYWLVRQEELNAVRVEVDTFSLLHTVGSAQPLTFFGDYSNDSVQYPAGCNYMKVQHTGAAEQGELVAKCADRNFAKKELWRRFRLNDNMQYIYKKINTDRHLDASIRRYSGMRLTLNEPWETTVCFIISQFNNVKRIRLIVKNLIRRYGTDIVDENGSVVGKSFPSSVDLMGATKKELLECGTGFRAKYIMHAADYCTNNINLDRLNPHDYDRLKETLMEIDGVGVKVADCIILMGYGNLKAFPIDVHIKRAMERLYFNGRRKRLKDINEIADRMWGSYRGYAQQYLFHNSRTGDLNDA